MYGYFHFCDIFLFLNCHISVTILIQFLLSCKLYFAILKRFRNNRINVIIWMFGDNFLIFFYLSCTFLFSTYSILPLLARQISNLVCAFPTLICIYICRYTHINFIIFWITKKHGEIFLYIRIWNFLFSLNSTS